LTVTFQDGEPVDPKKLQDLQTQIDSIKLQSDETYNLSKTTANSITTLAVMHLKAGVVTFENGLTGGKVTPIDIDLDWGPDYEIAYVVATPRNQDPKTNNMRWSISGQWSGSTKLNVYAEKTISGPVNFHWLSAGKKVVSKP
jgi:hypothetical protein